MSVIKSFGQGVRRAAGEGKLLLLLWLFNVVFGFVLYLQFSDFFETSLGMSAVSGNFLKGIDFNHAVEIMIYRSDGLGRVVSIALYLSLIYGFVSVFLSGGILHTIRARGKGERLGPVFFQGAGKYFGRFFRLFLYSSALWGAAFVVISILMGILGPDNGNEPAILWGLAVVAVVGAFLLFLVKMIVDYARIRIVVDDRRDVLRSLLGAIGFVRRRFGRALGLYYLWILIGTAVLVAAWAVESSIETYSMLPILIVFLAGQVFIVARNWARVGLQAAQMDFYNAAVPAQAATAPIPPAEEAQVPAPAVQDVVPL